MEWVETTGKTLEAAKDKALDQLGVARDEAEFDVLEEPRSGLFGLLRGEARVRARVKPAEVRPKNDRRRNRKGADKKSGKSRGSGSSSKKSEGQRGGQASAGSDKKTGSDKNNRSSSSDRSAQRTAAKEETMDSSNSVPQSDVSPDEVASAADAFLAGLVDAFGLTADVSSSVDDNEIDVTVEGDELGLMIGPSGRTLNAIQDLTRVSAQRRLGDHETRLRIDVGGYREKRRVALDQFTRKVAQDVIDSGEPRAMEPMSSADRKVVHDTVNEMEGVESRSDGADPSRRVVIVPAEDET